LALYLDSSALAKFVTGESEAPALEDYLGARILASSALAKTELLRVAFRTGEPDAIPTAQTILRRMRLVAQRRDPHRRSHPPTPSLRTLDAIHLASALVLGPDLEAVVTYDARMAEAAGWLGIDAVAPS
jgi:predicted nucleic acid-binding protein